MAHDEDIIREIEEPVTRFPYNLTGDYARDLEALREYLRHNPVQAAIWGLDGESPTDGLMANGDRLLALVLDALIPIVAGLHRHLGEIEALLDSHQHDHWTGHVTWPGGGRSVAEVRGRTLDGGAS